MLREEVQLDIQHCELTHFNHSEVKMKNIAISSLPNELERNISYSSYQLIINTFMFYCTETKKRARVYFNAQFYTKCAVLNPFVQFLKLKCAFTKLTKIA
jgi:hypothetical protein